MTPLALIARHWRECAVARCRSAGRSRSCLFCSGPKSVILDCDKIRAAGRLLGVICDCLVFEQDGILHVGVVELKGRGYNLEHALEQLRAGEELAVKIMSGLGITKYKIYLILVAPSHSTAGIMLKHTNRSSLSPRRSRVITADCGDMFSCARRPRLSR